jgi:hypothetical protein
LHACSRTTPAQTLKTLIACEGDLGMKTSCDRCEECRLAR